MHLLDMYVSPLHLYIRLPPINALIRIFNPPLSLLIAFTITLTLTLTLKASSGGDARRMDSQDIRVQAAPSEVPFPFLDRYASVR